MKSRTKQAGTTENSAAETRSEIVRPARTELVWEGKYDADGRRVAPLRVTLPFQTVETVNESAADRRRTLELFGGRTAASQFLTRSGTHFPESCRTVEPSPPLPDSRTSASRLLLLNMNFGNMTHAEAMLSLRLFGTEVLPAFR